MHSSNYFSQSSFPRICPYATMYFQFREMTVPAVRRFVHDHSVPSHPFQGSVMSPNLVLSHPICCASFRNSADLISWKKTLHDFLQEMTIRYALRPFHLLPSSSLQIGLPFHFPRGPALPSFLSASPSCLISLAVHTISLDAAHNGNQSAAHTDN